jgi:hypothetical protein
VIMRLICCSHSDWLISQATSGLPAYPLWFERESVEIDRCGAFMDVLPFGGAYPPAHCANDGFTVDHAPWEPESTIFWSTSTSVDTAGWTEVVIQQRTHVLSNVITGHLAEVNASVDCVMAVAPQGDRRLRLSGDGLSDTCTCGCPGWFETNDSEISCPML